MNKNRLWTHDFTIITLGTVVSMLGNAISGYAIGIIVFNNTGSTFLFALFSVMYNLPKTFMPFLAGAFLDRFSRKKVIYTLDFISSGFYLIMFFMTAFDYFNYAVYLALCIFVGCIDSVYQLAYDSLYPTLITEGNMRRAYSISSMILPLSMVMVPVASLVYAVTSTYSPLFLFNAVTFFVAACFETRIRATEEHVKKFGSEYSARHYIKDFRDGLRYIRGEKGLLIITLYFFVWMMANNASAVLLLPWFKQQESFSLGWFDAMPNKGEMWFIMVLGCNVLGRVVGGALQYKIAMPAGKMFVSAIFLYTFICITEGTFLYLPVGFMMFLYFFTGIAFVVGMNIRTSTTQDYIPNEYRARYNGTFQTVNTLGSSIGGLVSGALAEFIEPRLVIAGFFLINLVCVYAIMYVGKKHVAPIYNRSL